LTRFVEKKEGKKEYVKKFNEKEQRKGQTRERRSKTVYIKGTEKEREIKSGKEKSWSGN